MLSSITNSSNGSWAQSITLSWDIEESGSGIKSVEWRLNDGTTWGSFGQNEWYGMTRTNERNDTIYIRVTDNVGNVSNIESTVLKIDKTAPSAPVITNNKNNVWSKDSVTVSMKSTDNRSGIARYEWYESGSWTIRAMNINDGIGSITYGAQRNETIRIRAVDNAGNVSSESTTIVKVDTTNPIAKISASVSGNSIRISASGSSDTNSGIKNYQYSRDNSTWYTSTSNSYTFTGLADGTYTVYVKVTDNSGRTSSVVNTKVTVKNNVYLYDYGNVNTLAGSFVTGTGSTIMSTWQGGGTVKQNDNNIQLNITGYTSYLDSSTRYRAVGVRTQKQIDLTNYKQACILYDLSIPAYAHYLPDSSWTAATGLRIAATTSTTNWYDNMAPRSAGYWTTYGTEYIVSKQTMCTDLSLATGNYYVLFHIDAVKDAYGAAPVAKIYQLYLVPN